MGLGGAIFEGNSKLFDGPLGVVKIGFKGYDLGKTTADCNLTPDQDVKDIIYQQDGTKAADHVRTGIDLVLTGTFGEIKTGLLVLLMAGLSTENDNPLDDTGTINRSIYQSMRDNEAGVLKVASVNENGVPSENLQDILNFYEAIAIVNGDLINWGADTQRNFPVEFKIKWHPFATGESSTKVGAFGYWGDPTTEDVPAIVWPDVEAPILESAAVVLATTMDITFNEDVAFKGAGAYIPGTIMATVDGIMILASSAAIVNKVVTATFPAATFSTGDVVELFITEEALEDTETTPNVYQGVADYPVTNPL